MIQPATSFSTVFSSASSPWRVGALLATALLLLSTSSTLLVSAMREKTLSYRSEMRVQPFKDIPTPSFYFVAGATVSIEIGYTQHDRLFFDYQGDFDIKGDFDRVNGVLYLMGRATTSEYAVAISSVVFTTASTSGAPRKITWSYGVNTFFFSLTNHFYRYYEKPGVSWKDAMNACGSTSFFNMTGYLATITSPDEMSEVGLKAKYSLWLGGSDATSEGQWTWKTGPEEGITFWSGLNMYAGGLPVNKAYSAWSRFQPNNGDGNGEHFLYLVNSADQATSYWADGAETDVVGGFLCEYGGLDDAEIADTAVEYMGTTELYLGCELFTFPTECNNRKDFGCVWSGGRCSQLSCAQYYDQQKCESDWHCNWNTNGMMGVCVDTRCAAYSTKTLCSADPACAVKSDEGSNACHVAKCSDKETSCSCNALSQCSWRNGQCAFDSSVDCGGMDVVYLLDGTSAMEKAYGKYDEGFFSLTDFFIDAHMTLSKTPAGTKYVDEHTFGMRVGFIQYGSSVKMTTDQGSHGRLTGDHREMIEDLEWHQRAFAPQGDSRSLNTALLRAQRMFKETGKSDRKKVIVIFCTGEVADAEALGNQFKDDKGVLYDLKEDDVVLVKIALRGLSPRSIFSKAAIASLQAIHRGDSVDPPVEEATLGQVTERVIYGMCNGTDLSKFLVPPKDELLCMERHSIAHCRQSELCSWDMATSSCKNSGCLRLCDDKCADDSSCMAHTSSNTCVQLCPTLNGTDCGEFFGVGVCGYDYGDDVCESLACLGNPNEDGCLADRDSCQYNENVQQCEKRACDVTDAKKCLGHIGCTWTGQECLHDVCSKETLEEDCAKFVQCEWKDTACKLNKCGSRYGSEKTCQRDSGCRWTVDQSPSACGYAPCTKYNFEPVTAEAMCSADVECAWQTADENKYGKAMCIARRCDVMTSSCECSSLPGCVWRGEQCKDERFVQCPGIDVIFLVEGSPVMMEDFGRHPNGYVGIIESIRSWSKQAPFSATPDTAGFRLGLYTYGHRRPLQQPASIGAGGELTSDPEKWLGVDQTLDYFETRIQDYATSGDADISIKSALQLSLETFNNSPQPTSSTRAKMVVILGHSPIGDGDNNLNREITMLEESGVKIFANVLRRFSEMTPGDLHSAEFMRPLASDPPSIHFLFTTIDDMKNNLLEKFCNPSTGTGKVLQVSRDKELPCSWLSKSECTLQGSCNWNSTSTLVCPNADECPNLDCRPLPNALKAAGFDCKHCLLFSGQFQCSRQNTIIRQPGACVRAKCMYTCKDECESDSGCHWSSKGNRCERGQCGYTGVEDCNDDMACVWNQTSPTGGSCQRSLCGRLRSTSSCKGFEQPHSEVQKRFPCIFDEDLTPAVCVQRRCPLLKKDECEAPDQQHYCVYDNIFGCRDKVCAFPTSETCGMHETCYWDKFKQRCFEAQKSCVLSDYSDWAPCSASCGDAMTYKSRIVVRFPTDREGLSCKEVAEKDCPSGTNLDDCKITVIKSCSTNNKDWPQSCPLYCLNKRDRLECIHDNSCRWLGGVCKVKPFMGCPSLSKDDCDTSDMCSFNKDLHICEASMTVCPFSTQEQCMGVDQCRWYTGAAANRKAIKEKIPVQLFNPGQKDIYPFYDLAQAINSEDVVNGAAVTIEENYQRGKDILDLAFGNIQVAWNEQAGSLLLFGDASVSEYAEAIRFVTFTTTATVVSPRRITWSFGKDTFYSSRTKHHYRAYSQVGITYDAAVAACAGRSLGAGLRAYLATVTSMEENDLVSAKALGVGWVSGDDINDGFWKFSTGPEKGQQIWKGGSTSFGGGPIGDAFTNWFPSNSTNIHGEPVLNTGAGGATGEDRIYLSRSGYWVSRLADSLQVDGYVCEFGGLDTDVIASYPLGGATIIGIAGCVATPTCIWHNTQEECELDAECAWSNGICSAGCGSYATESECGQTAMCRWDTAEFPALCDRDRCAPLGISACALDRKCEWDPVGMCKYRRGCARYTGSRECGSEITCKWNGVSCLDRACPEYGNLKDCRENPTCRWSEGTCTTAYCISGSKEICEADVEHCVWNTVDSMSIGFPPNGADITPFHTGVEPPSEVDVLVDGVTIIIAEGFQKGYDILRVDPRDNLRQQFTITFNALTGVMKLIVNPGVQVKTIDAFMFIRKAVKFSSESTNPTKRTISYVLSSNSFYSTMTSSIFKVRPVTSVTTFEEAQQACQDATIFGLSGVLATVNNSVDNLALERLEASGWIAAHSAGDSQWKWATNSSSNGGVLFWTGLGVMGKPVTMTSNITGFSSTYYAQWGSGEPARAKGTAYFERSGKWKVIQDNQSPPPVPNVICKYPYLTSKSGSAISGKRTAVPAGCFVAQCLSLDSDQCKENAQCMWNPTINKCTRDVGCLMGSTPHVCNNLELCYWDYDLGYCRSAPVDSCSSIHIDSTCRNTTSCNWSPGMIPRNSARGLGGCRREGCAGHHDSSDCSANAVCQWTGTTGPCIPRLCGYMSEDACWRDNLCIWESTEERVGCKPSPCSELTHADICDGTDTCSYNNQTKYCEYKRCSTRRGMAFCMSDTACLYLNGQCLKPDCSSITEASCSANAECYFSIGEKKCRAQQCMTNTNKGSCEQGQTVISLKPCIWESHRHFCRQPTFAEQHAPLPKENACEREENPNMWWLWVYLVVILLLLGAIIHRLYLAYSKGFNFFEPTRKNYKYNPHQMYASELFEESGEREQEKNILIN